MLSIVDASWVRELLSWVVLSPSKAVDVRDISVAPVDTGVGEGVIACR